MTQNPLPQFPSPSPFSFLSFPSPKHTQVTDIKTQFNWQLTNTMFSWLKKSTAVNETPSQSYWMSLAMWDHTVLPATRHTWTHPALTPARQADTGFTYPGWMEGWVGLHDLLPTEMVYLSSFLYWIVFGRERGYNRQDSCSVSQHLS